MNPVTTGKIIARLRREKNLTQSALAKLLSISDKTVSKWESGAGYPEITQLPALAKIFGTTVDYLINGGGNGVTIAGNILIDNVKIIEKFPEQGMLAIILSESPAVGGCVPNTAIDLAKIDPSVPVSACGLVGDDEAGRYVTMQMQKYGINTSRIKLTTSVPTGHSDVMTAMDTGARTFFLNRGTNSVFAPDDIDVDALDCKIFHIGYILLLERFDREDEAYGTAMAELLSRVQARGIKTSFDVVSDSSGKFREKVIPALKYSNYAIMNEIEAGGVSGLDARNADGSLNITNIRRTLEIFFENGVSDLAVIHCPEAGFCMNAAGEFTAVPSLKLPDGYIKGSVGAGDAFCAGVLYGLTKGMPEKEILEFASGAAACNLSEKDSVSGMRQKADIIKFINETERLDLCW